MQTRAISLPSTSFTHILSRAHRENLNSLSLLRAHRESELSLSLSLSSFFVFLSLAVDAQIDQRKEKGIGNVQEVGHLSKLHLPCIWRSGGSASHEDVLQHRPLSDEDVRIAKMSLRRTNHSKANGRH